jgi:hypothetical protein
MDGEDDAHDRSDRIGAVHGANARLAPWRADERERDEREGGAREECGRQHHRQRYAMAGEIEGEVPGVGLR